MTKKFLEVLFYHLIYKFIYYTIEGSFMQKTLNRGLSCFLKIRSVWGIFLSFSKYDPNGSFFGPQKFFAVLPEVL
jgi:hypothetical protein